MRYVPIAPVAPVTNTLMVSLLSSLPGDEVGPATVTPSRPDLLFRLQGMESYEELRPYLFAIAYRMLGSVAEAEDVVQDAFLRYQEADVEAESPKAYLATVTTRLAIDRLRRARARVEEGRRRFDVSREQRDEVAARFMAAWEEGDTDALLEVLAPDVTVY